jgi:hypothetical protein
MKSLGFLLVAAFVLLVVAAQAPAQSPTCKTAEYSEAVIEALPDVRDLCLRIEKREGNEFAVVQAEVSRVHRQDALEVRFKRPDGSKSPSRYFKTAPERRILVEGKSMRVQDVTVGQELTAYIQVRKPVIAAEPALPGDPLDPAPIETHAPDEER